MTEAVQENAMFEKLKSQAQQAVDSGRLGDAAALIEQALEWAQENGTRLEIDHAICNRAAISIQLGGGEAELPRLREILLRGSDPNNCRLAAYHISVHYQYAKNFQKSLFYARIARDRAQILDVAEWLATSLNQVGNALLGASFVEEASREYEKALELMPRESLIGRGQILNNLGYCRVLQKRFREGYTCLYEALSIPRQLGVGLFQVLPHLDLCFAHLETGRYAYAERHGRKALRLAEENEYSDAIKNALYLLGEVANLRGDVELAHSYFSRLQEDFFPGQTYLPSFLLAVDVRKLVNLHA
jgi:tetratricopeptide (TPR) repeat protein